MRGDVTAGAAVFAGEVSGAVVGGGTGGEVFGGFEEPAEGGVEGGEGGGYDADVHFDPVGRGLAFGDKSESYGWQVGFNREKEKSKWM